MYLSTKGGAKKGREKDGDGQTSKRTEGYAQRKSGQRTDTVSTKKGALKLVTKKKTLAELGDLIIGFEAALRASVL